MNSIVELHKEHVEWLSEIEFMLKEIAIFEHMIEKYKKDYNDSEFDFMASTFYDSFEHIKSKLHKMKVEIEFHEGVMKEAIVENSADVESNTFKNQIHLRKHMDDALERLKVFKESLYDYIAVNKK